MCARAVTAVELPAGAPEIQVCAVRRGVPGQALRLRHAVTLLGAHDDNKIRLCHERIAAVQAAIVNTGSAVYLRAVPGKIETRVNGAAVALARLADGDLIQIHTFTLRVTLSGDGAPDQQPLPWLALGLPDGGVVPVVEPAVIIGRQDSSDIIVPKPGISRWHALLWRVGNAAAVCDLHSQNGVGVDDRRVTVAALAAGQTLHLGRESLAVLAPEAAPPDDHEAAGETEVDVAAPRAVPEIATPATPVDPAAVLATFDVRERELLARSERIEAEFRAHDEQLAAQAAALDRRFEDLDRREAHLKQEQQTLATALDAFHARQTALADQIAGLDQRGAELQASAAALQAHESRLQTAVDERAAQDQDLEARAAALARERAVLDRRTTELGDTARRLEVQTAALEQRQAALAEREGVLQERSREQDRLAASLSTWESTMRAMEHDLLLREPESSGVEPASTVNNNGPSADHLQVRARELEAVRRELDLQLEQVARQERAGQQMLAQIQTATEDIDRRERLLAEREQQLAARVDDTDPNTADQVARAAELQQLESHLAAELERAEREGAALTALQAEVERTASALTAREQRVAEEERAHRARREALDDAEAAVERRAMQVAERERCLERQQLEWEGRRAELEQRLADIDQRQTAHQALTAQASQQDARIRARDAESLQRSADLEARARELTQRAEHVAGLEEALARRAAEIESAAAECASARAQLDSARAEHARAERAFHERRDALAARDAAFEVERQRVAERDAACARAQTRLDEQLDATTQRAAQLASAAERLDAREVELARHAQRLDERAEAFASGESERAAAAQAMNERLAELETRARQVAEAEAKLREREAAVQRDVQSAAHHRAATDHAIEQQRRTVADTEARCQRLATEVTALRQQLASRRAPGSSRPVDLSASQIVSDSTAADNDSTAQLDEPKAPATAASALEHARLDPEVADALRMLRRMGVDGEEHELLEQARLEVAHRRRAMGRDNPPAGG